MEHPVTGFQVASVHSIEDFPAILNLKQVSGYFQRGFCTDWVAARKTEKIEGIVFGVRQNAGG